MMHKLTLIFCFVVLLLAAAVWTSSGGSEAQREIVEDDPVVGTLMLSAFLPPKPEYSNIIFSDIFADNSKGWDEKHSGVERSAFINGRYLMELPQDELEYRSGQRIDIDPQKDFLIEVIGKVVDGESRFYGIFWENDRKHTYVFKISQGPGTAQGTYTFYKNVGWMSDKKRHRKSEEIIKNTSSPHIASDAANKITVARMGDRIRFYVNDNFLTQVPYSAFHIRHLGLHIEGRMTVEFDDFLVKTDLKGPSENGNIKRRILPDGMIELHYPDGTVEHRRSGGFWLGSGDEGTRHTSINTPSDLPISLPADAANWFVKHRNKLLSIMEGLVNDTSIQNYLNVEAIRVQKYFQDEGLKYNESLSSCLKSHYRAAIIHSLLDEL